MRKRLGALAVASLAGMIACNVLIGLRDDYRISPEDGASEAEVKDGAIDGTITDVDAGPTSSPCVDASHALCCDFDQPDALAACWNGQIFTNMGTLSVSDAQAVSIPRSMHAMAPVGGHAYGKRITLGMLTMSATCSFDVWVEAITGPTTLVASIFANMDDNQSVALVFDPLTNDGGLTGEFAHLYGIQKDGGKGFGAGGIVLPPRAWVRLELVIDAATNGSATFRSLSFDAGTVLFATNITSPSLFGFRAGLLFVTTGSSAVYIDNIICDTK